MGKKIKWGRREGEGKRDDGKVKGRGKKGKGKDKNEEIRKREKWEGIKLMVTLYTPGFYSNNNSGRSHLKLTVSLSKLTA